MKKVFSFLFFIVALQVSYAQDESYRGGIADGHGYFQNGSVFGISDVFQPYFGGYADGYANESLISFNQYSPALLFAPFSGSTADGYATDSLINFNQYATIGMYGPYVGNFADGYAGDSLMNFDQYASINMFAPFLGNIGDGHAHDSLIAFPPYNFITMFQPYAGGEADGWAGYPVFGIVVIPVNLLSFFGEKADKQHLLKWSTSQEQNSSHFELERSIDGRHFSKIGTTAAAGNSNTEKNYQYSDATPMQGNNFYRLKMVDLNGTAKYSNIILLRVNGENASMVIYPNPATKTLNVEISAVDNDKTVNAAIFDFNGKLLQSHILKSTNTLFQFDVQSLSSGVYILRVIWNNETYVWRFVKN